MNEINEPSVLGFEIKTDTFAVPSGFNVIIRETNGQDDAVLSNIKSQQDQKALNKYLANIIIEIDGNKDVKANDILLLRVRDKYFILYKIRRLSLGDEVRWVHKFEDGLVRDIVEDLKKYDWDYIKGAPPLKGQDGYDPLIAAAYNKEPYIKFKLSSGHEVQFNYMTGIEEKSVLGVDEANVDINSKLVNRKFKYFRDESDEEGTFIENFQMFPSRIMAEIRARLETYDSEWTLSTDIKHPISGQVTTISMFGLPDFFYPGA